MALHDAFYPLLLPELPGCPLPTIRSAINRAAARFCERTKAWIEALDPIVVLPGIASYELEAPADATIIVIHQAWIDGREIKPAIDGASQYAWGEILGPASHYSIAHAGRALVLNKEPVDRASLTLTGVLAPTLDAASLPDILANRHFEAIAEGAKSILKRIPNQPWSDPAGAMAAEAAFSNRSDEARIGVEFGHVRGSMSVTPRAFGA